MKGNNHANERGDPKAVAGDMRSFVIEDASEGNHLKIFIGEHENRKVFRSSKKAVNDFLQMIVKSLNFDKKEKFGLKWKSHELSLKEGLSYTFNFTERQWMVPSPSVSLSGLITNILKTWQEEYQSKIDNIYDSEIYDWEEGPHNQPMFAKWLFEFLIKLNKQLDKKNKIKWGSINSNQALRLDKHIDRESSLIENTVIEKGNICNDAQLICNLFLFNEQNWHVNNHSLPNYQPDSTDIIKLIDNGHYDSCKQCTFWAHELLWKSNTRRRTNYQERRQGEVMAFIDYEKFPNKLMKSRAWILKESCFCGKSRVTANKFIMDKNNNEYSVLVAKKLLKSNQKNLEQITVDLMNKLLGSNKRADLLEESQGELYGSIIKDQIKKKLRNEDNLRENITYKLKQNRLILDMMDLPSFSRELPFTGRGILDYLSKEMLKEHKKGDSKTNLELFNLVLDDLKPKSKAHQRVLKHRLSGKLTEIANFLHWWADIGPILKKLFRDNHAEFEAPIIDFGNALRNAWDYEFEASDATGEMIWEE